jgi:hypothetical protein
MGVSAGNNSRTGGTRRRQGEVRLEGKREIWITKRITKRMRAEVGEDAEFCFLSCADVTTAYTILLLNPYGKITTGKPKC